MRLRRKSDPEQLPEVTNPVARRMMKRMRLQIEATGRGEAHWLTLASYERRHEDAERRFSDAMEELVALRIVTISPDGDVKITNTGRAWLDQAGDLSDSNLPEAEIKRLMAKGDHSRMALVEVSRALIEDRPLVERDLTSETLDDWNPVPALVKLEEELMAEAAATETSEGVRLAFAVSVVRQNVPEDRQGLSPQD